MQGTLQQMFGLPAAGGSALRRGIEALTTSGALLGFAAASVAGLAGTLLCRQLPLNVLVFTGLVAASSYFVDHVADAPGQSNAVRWRCGLSLTLTALAAAKLLFDDAWAYVVAIFYPASVVAYARVKAIPYVKAAYVPAAWGSLVALPLLATRGPFQPAPTALLFVIVVAQVAIMATACDIRDSTQDRTLGLRTLATLYSPSKLLPALQVTNGVVVLMALSGMATGLLPMGAAVFVGHAALTWLVLRNMKSASAGTVRFLTGVVLDGALALPYPLLALLRHWGALT